MLDSEGLAHIAVVTRSTSAGSAVSGNMEVTKSVQVPAKSWSQAARKRVFCSALYSKVGVVQGVDSNHTDDPLGHQPRRLEGHRPAHGVADQDHLLETEVLDHGLDIGAEGPQGSNRRGPFRTARGRGGRW